MDDTSRQLLVDALQALTTSHAAVASAHASLHRAHEDVASALDAHRARIADLDRLMAALRVDTDGQPAASAPPTAAVRDLPVLTIVCFGPFAIERGGLPIEPCKNRSGQTILRYLAVHPRHEASSDTLMDALWPEDPPEIARHKLHCATSALRRTLNGDLVGQREAGYLLCDHGVYALNPRIAARIDVDEFVAAYQAGTRSGGAARISHFQAACRLYVAPLLPEDLYANWSAIRREQLVQFYLTMCGALTTHYLAESRFDEACAWALRILAENRCDESAYRQLILAHAGAGRRAEALRQYRRCEQTLAAELGVAPLPQTSALLQSVLRGEAVLPSRISIAS